MNYADDIFLQDVYFANDKVGWISGGGRGTNRGGFIFHTADGGQHWDLQVGDPHSNTPEVNTLRFLDATHGWAMQGGQLIRTVDGTTWQTIGPLPGRGGTAGGSAGFQFTSLQDGFEIAGDYSGATVYATHDGGHSWKPVYECATTLQVSGLTRNTNCRLHDLRFVSPQVAYAAGGGDHWAAIVKTTDGGATWRVIFARTDLEEASTVFFTDENNGVVRLWDSRILITADGGQTWRGAAGKADAAIKFADPEVGWSCNLQAYVRCSYTVDGGKNWISRDFSFPAEISEYSMPRRDRIYVVGDHGMMYRYRIVAVGPTPPGSLDAPVMPSYGGPILTQLQQMQTQVAALQSQLGGAVSSGTAPSAVSMASSPVQGTTISGGVAPDSSSQDPNATAAGFAQTTSSAPSSQFVESCCSTQVQGLVTSFSSMATQVPAFSSQYRDLNLLFVGSNMQNDMLSRAKAMHDSLLALKNAPHAQAARGALDNLAANIQDTTQAITTQFQSLSAGPASPSENGVFANQAIPSTAAPANAAAQNANANANANQATSSSATPANANTSSKVMQQLKKKIPF